MTLSALTAADQASCPQPQADGTIYRIATIGAVRREQTGLTDRPQRTTVSPAPIICAASPTSSDAGRLTPTIAWVTSSTLPRWRGRPKRRRRRPRTGRNAVRSLRDA